MCFLLFQLTGRDMVLLSWGLIDFSALLALKIFDNRVSFDTMSSLSDYERFSYGTCSSLF